MTNHRNNTETRRRGIVLLYTLSVLMIVLSLGFAYTQASFAMARGLGSSAFQQMAYQAALSGHSYGSSYIQQMVDARMHGDNPRYPIEQNCGAGIAGSEGMEWWAGRERCPNAQCGVQEAKPNPDPAFGCGGLMRGVETWFHYSDVIPPGQATERYRLWFRLQMNESLTRNGYLYSDENYSVFPCGTSPNQANLVTPVAACTKAFPTMLLGPFVPCGPCPSTPGQNMAPYPASNQIQYILTSIGVVEAVSADTGAFAPVAWSQVDAPFHINVGGYLDGDAGSACLGFRARVNHPTMFERFPDWEGQQGATRTPFMNLHPQPYIYFYEPMIEVVRAPPDRPNANAPSFTAGGARPPAVF